MAILALCAATGLLACSSTNERAEEQNALDLDEAEGAHSISYEVSLQRLGAPDGGAWIARIEGGRVILWLGRDYAGYDGAYVVVLRRGEPPRAFGIYSPEVTADGDLIVGLAPVRRVADGSVYVPGRSPHIDLFAVVQGKGDVIRVNSMLGDEDGVFPPGVQLRRCSKRAQQEVWRTIEESIR